MRENDGSVIRVRLQPDVIAVLQARQREFEKDGAPVSLAALVRKIVENDTLSTGSKKTGRRGR
jgi:hypothetical protein